MPSLYHLGLCLVFALQQVNQAFSAGVEPENFDALHGYVPINPEVEDLANIARDLEAMHNELKRKTDAGVNLGMKIYENGGYSRAVCTVHLEEGLEDAIPAGTIFKAKGQGGEIVTARTENHHSKGAQQVKLMYNQVLPCHVGGLPEEVRDLEGCFDSPGAFTVGDFESEYSFTYDKIEGNINERTMKAMSDNSARKFRHNGAANQGYYLSFQKFVDYFGEPDFADKMITAAGEFGKYDFAEGHFDFSTSTNAGRSDFIKFFSAYLNIGLFVISELENAVEKCADHCAGEGCLHASIHALDGAVSYYTGSLQSEDGNGNLLYALANDMCYYFKTCGPKGDSVEGVAKVNIDIFEEFKEMQEHLINGECPQATANKDQIINHMFVPLIQGFSFAVYRRSSTQHWGENYKVEDAAPFAAAVLPLLGYCKMPEAKEIQINFAPGHEQTTEDLKEIQEHLHEHMECMGLCCHEVGGLWNTRTNDYHFSMEPCVDTRSVCIPKPEPVVEEEKSTTWMWIVLLAAVLITGYLYRRRMKERKRRLRAAAERDDPRDLYQDRDDASVDSDKGPAFA